MKIESRRYNALNETNKEFYMRRTKDMNDFLESAAFVKWNKKNWAEYKEAQIKNNKD
tara:strand:+ start:417 stop:587 length:171 start_codon:yes stop_codon:yes gene_type:complete